MTVRLHTPQPYIYIYIYIYIYKVSASSACDAQAPAMTAYAPFLLAYAPFALDRLRHMDCRMCMCVCVCVCTFPLRLIHASTTPGQFGSRFRVQFRGIRGPASNSTHTCVRAGARMRFYIYTPRPHDSSELACSLALHCCLSRACAHARSLVLLPLSPALSQNTGPQLIHTYTHGYMSACACMHACAKLTASSPHLPSCSHQLPIGAMYRVYVQRVFFFMSHTYGCAGGRCE